MSMANDFGDIGDRWTALWRRVHVAHRAMSGLKVDVQLRLLKEAALRLDNQPNWYAQDLLEQTLKKLEKDTAAYVLHATKVRHEVLDFALELRSHLDGQPTAKTPEPEVYNGIDDDIVDRMARFYTDKGHRI